MYHQRLTGKPLVHVHDGAGVGVDSKLLFLCNCTSHSSGSPSLPLSSFLLPSISSSPSFLPRPLSLILLSLVLPHPFSCPPFLLSFALPFFFILLSPLPSRPPSLILLSLLPHPIISTGHSRTRGECLAVCRQLLINRSLLFSCRSSVP